MIRSPRLVIALQAISASAVLLLAAVAPAASVVELPKKVIRAPQLPDTTRYGYAQVTVAAPNMRMIYVSGQTGLADDGRPNDFNSLVDRSFVNLLIALRAAGGQPSDVVKITLLIKDHDTVRLKYLIDKRRAFFSTSPPASTLIPVLVLLPKVSRPRSTLLPPHRGDACARFCRASATAIALQLTGQATDHRAAENFATRPNHSPLLMSALSPFNEP